MRKLTVKLGVKIFEALFLQSLMSDLPFEEPLAIRLRVGLGAL